MTEEIRKADEIMQLQVFFGYTDEPLASVFAGHCQLLPPRDFDSLVRDARRRGQAGFHQLKTRLFDLLARLELH